MSIKAHKLIIIYIAALLALSGSGIAGEKDQAVEKFEMTIDNIMEGQVLYGTPPSGIMWSQDGKQLYFIWKKPEAEKAELYVLNIPSKTPIKIDPDQLLKNPPLPPRASFSFRSRYGMSGLSIKYNKNRTKALISRNSDIFVMSIPSGKIKRLTYTDDRESNANFAFDQNKIFFTSRDNLFLLSIKDYSLRQMTSFTRKPPPPQKKAG